MGCVMLNRIVLIGRLTKDPELRYTQSGKAVCVFTFGGGQAFIWLITVIGKQILLISWFGTKRRKTVLSIWPRASWPRLMAGCKSAAMTDRTVNAAILLRLLRIMCGFYRLRARAASRKLGLAIADITARLMICHFNFEGGLRDG